MVSPSKARLYLQKMSSGQTYKKLLNAPSALNGWSDAHSASLVSDNLASPSSRKELPNFFKEILVNESIDSKQKDEEKQMPVSLASTLPKVPDKRQTQALEPIQ